MRLNVKKVEAGALQYAIAVSVIIGGILSAFLLYTHIQLKFSKQSEWASNSIKLSEDGLRYAEHHVMPYMDTMYLEREPDAEIHLHKSHWGVYDIVSTTGIVNNFKHRSTVLSGASMSRDDRLALHIPNNNQPLVLAGSAKLYGDVQLSERGIKAGSIGGTYFQSEILVNGNQLSKFSDLPIISEEKLAYFKELLAGTLPEDFEYIPLDNDSVIARSFDEATGVISSSETIYLDKVSLTGNIIVMSEKAIHVSAFAKAQHLLLLAPEIIIASTANVQLQAFASTSILVEKGAQLKYPSALVVIPKDSVGIESPRIILEHNAKVEGSVVYMKEIALAQRTTEVLISEGAAVYGEMYSQGHLELKGNVYGSVYTNNFTVNYRGSLYINHIMNGIIDTRNIPENFGGLLGTGDKHNNLLWLD